MADNKNLIQAWTEASKDLEIQIETPFLLKGKQGSSGNIHRVSPDGTKANSIGDNR